MKITLKVCVVMPVYNGADTITSALNSLICQSYQNWLCVIVNDGSTDRTKSILDNITDSRFKIIHLPSNMGRGYARQVALDNAEGDLLTYLDADDFYHPHKIMSQVEIFNSNPEVSLVSCAQGSFDNNLTLKSVRGFKFQGKYDFSFGQDIRFIPVTSMILLKPALQFTYNSGLNASEDVDFFSKYLEGKSYYIYPILLYYYSEYQSIKYSKIIEYLLNDMKYFYIVRSRTGSILAAKKIAITLLKLILTAVFFPMLGKKVFLSRRGSKPDKDHIDEFERICDLLTDK